MIFLDKEKLKWLKKINNQLFPLVLKSGGFTIMESHKTGDVSRD